MAATAAPTNLVRPFFIAAGFRRPHLPWQMPKAYWDMFSDTSLAPPAHPTVPEGLPPVAFTCGDNCFWELNTTERTKHNFTIDQPVPTALARTLRRAYLASMAFMDAQVGRVLSELDTLGFSNETLVVLHGDHGWGLGEGNFWHKFSNMEHSARVPLLVRAPWLGARASGRVVPNLVELVDVFPSMARLAGTATPTFANGSSLPLDGADFSSLLLGVNTSAQKQYAYSQFPRCDNGIVSRYAHNYCKTSKNKDLDFMGYSIRDVRFRYTVWLPWDGKALRGKWESAPEGEELYDHDGDDGSDFDAFPVGWKNLAQEAAHAMDKQRLSAALRAFFDK